MPKIDKIIINLESWFWKSTEAENYYGIYNKLHNLSSFDLYPILVDLKEFYFPKVSKIITLYKLNIKININA